MKLINNYISEKLIINKDTDCGQHLINNINQSLLKYFSKDTVDEIIDWANNLPIEIRPRLITNTLNPLHLLNKFTISVKVILL